MSSLKHIVSLAALALTLLGCALDAGGELTGGEGPAAQGTQAQHVRVSAQASSAAASAQLSDAHVLVFRGTIPTLKHVMPALELSARAQKPLLLVTGERLPESVVRELDELRLTGLLQVQALSAPEGEGGAWLERLAHACAGTVLEHESELGELSLDDLGYARSVTLGAHDLTFLPGR